MKVTKTGNIRLEKGEVRIGNFFFRDEGDNERIKVSDLNSCFTLRIWKRMPLGIWLDNMLKRGKEGEGSLKAWVGVMWSVMSCAPDDEFVSVLFDATKDNYSRHPEWYGGKKNATEEEDARALAEVEGVTQLEGEINEAFKDVKDEA